MISRSSPWIRHGFWNTLEHGIIRVADGLTTLVLVWVLEPEIFSRLAMAQAAVAPLLLFFIAPETILYRDFAKWSTLGPAVMSYRISAFRRFGYFKLIAVFFLSLLVGAGLSYWRETPYLETVWCLVWAFALALGPQIYGADREYLRISLNLKTLNSLSLFHKLSLFLGTVAVAKLSPGNLEGLSVVALVSVGVTAVAARFFVRKHFNENPEFQSSSKLPETEKAMLPLLQSSLKDFSFWQHLQGISLNWVHTLDLFCLGLFQFPARVTGLYAVVLKLVNFFHFIPLALSNAVGIWLGRRTTSLSSDAHEFQKVKKGTGYLALGVVVQGVVFYALAPFLISVVSRGRWSQEEQQEMLSWFGWILAGNLILAGTYFVYQWVQVRTAIQSLFQRVYLPWILFSFAVYSGAAYVGAKSFGMDPLLVAKFNGLVSLIYVVLVVGYLRAKVRIFSSNAASSQEGRIDS